jgi:hypothetical protein
MATTERFSQRWDAAQRACRDGQLQTLQWLFEKAQFFEGRQALREACISGAWGSGNEEILTQPYSTTDSVRLHTMLQTATARGHVDIVRYLLEQFPAKDLHVLEWEIILSAIGQGSLDLLEAFAVVDRNFVHMSRPQFGNCFTALFSLVKEPEYHLPVVQFLLDSGAQPDEGVPLGNTLREAVASSTPDVLRTLKLYGAKGDELQMLAVAAGAGNANMVKHLLENGADANQDMPLDETSNTPKSAIVVAELNGYQDIVKLLRAFGAVQAPAT